MTDAASPTENEIYERMAAAILDHRLPPGMKLIEDRLATAFGVSRTRIRPVLVRRVNQQIATLTPNCGAMVAQATEGEAREVFKVRRTAVGRLPPAHRRRLRPPDAGVGFCANGCHARP